MTMRRSYTKTLMLGLLATFTAMVSLAAVAMTTDPNAGVEPGDGCEAVSPGFVCSPVPVPMGGEAAVTFLTTTLNPISRFSGRVDQFDGDCFIESEQNLSNFIPDKKTFDSLRARDLRGFCLQQIFIEGSCPAAALSFAEVVEAKRLIQGNNIHKFDVLVLPLNCVMPPP